MTTYNVYLTSGQIKQAVLEVATLGNGHDKYALHYDGQRVQGGVVKAGTASVQVKKYFLGFLSVESVFAV